VRGREPTAAEVRGDGGALVGQAVAGRSEQDRIHHCCLPRERGRKREVRAPVIARLRRSVRSGIPPPRWQRRSCSPRPVIARRAGGWAIHWLKPSAALHEVGRDWRWVLGVMGAHTAR
jgi:hypothetical protein